MKNCKQLSEEILQVIEQRTQRQKRIKKHVKRTVISGLLVIMIPLSFAFATGHVSVAPLFEPIEKTWGQSDEDSSEILPRQSSVCYDI